MSLLSFRTATMNDLAALGDLMNAAIGILQKPFLSEAQIASSRAIMGLDSQLIADGTFFAIEESGSIVGCGGWSRRATLYGGDNSPGRSAALLNPATDPARIRAMYTHPNHARRGIGRMVLELSENAARAEGFRRMELMATLAGLPLYSACGYSQAGEVSETAGGVAVPLVRMSKAL